MKKTFVSTIISAVTLLLCSTAVFAQPLINKTGETLLFDFGEHAEYNWIKVDQNSKYTAETGYGWSMISFIENKPLSGSSVLSDAIATKPNMGDKTEFQVDVAPGIYDVSVYSGDIRFMSVSLEGHPSIINIEYPFSEARVQIPVTDNQLNMKLIYGNAGTDLSIAAMTITKVGDISERKKRVFICSDSTAATFYPLFMYQPLEDGYRGGWGQMLSAYLKDSVYVHNISSAGQTAKSFIESGRLDSVLFFMQQGDYALISLGANDAGAYSESEYEQYMSQIIEAIKNKGGIPVVISSPPYLFDFDSNGNYNNADRSFCAKACEVAGKFGLTYIDLNRLSSDFYSQIGSEQLTRMYWTMWDGQKDSIHLSRNGAGQLARLIAEECAKNGFDFVSDKTAESVNISTDAVRVKTLKNNVYIQNIHPAEKNITTMTYNYRSSKLSDSQINSLTLPAFDVLDPYKKTEIYLPLYDSCKRTFLLWDKLYLPLGWVSE